MGDERSEIARQVASVRRDMEVKVGVLRRHAEGLEQLYVKLLDIYPVVTIDSGGPAGRVDR